MRVSIALLWRRLIHTNLSGNIRHTKNWAFETKYKQGKLPGRRAGSYEISEVSSAKSYEVGSRTARLSIREWTC